MAAGDNSTLYVLYGSATGNAEGISKDLTADLNDNKATRLPAPFKKAVCLELNQFKKALKEWAVAPTTTGQKYGALMVSSTTGNGDPPENAGRFLRYIKKQNKDDSKPKPFEHVAYAVLALGDTNYDQFCATGITIDRMVDSLGGTRAKPIVCADEGTGLLEETVEPWMANIVQDLAKTCEASACEEEKVDTDARVDTNAESTSSADAVTETPSSEAAVPPAPETSPSPLYILYGSATGNAEAIAKDLAATYDMILKNPDSKTYFPEVVCAELNQFKKLKFVDDVWSKPPVPGNDSIKHGVLIVASTTGNGDPPENSDKFQRYVKKSSRTASKDSSFRPFEHVAFAVLGLGDTNYDQFCEHAKVLNKHMLGLGGTEIRPLTCADEGTGQLEEVVQGWTANILMDITIACRGDVSTTNTAVTSKSNSSAKKQKKKAVREEEEKKVEPLEDVYTSSVTTSPGVLMVQSLVSSKNFGVDPNITPVEQSTLPKSVLASHVTSVEFVDDDYATAGNDTVEDDELSEDGVRYTLDSPFESSIVGARYLTATSSEAANEINEARNASSAAVVAGDVLDRRFPLQVENDVTEASRNGKRVVELTLSLPEDKSWEYLPGDSLGLIVSNAPEAVAFVLAMLKTNHGISPTQKVSIDSGEPRTVEEIVRDKIDLCTVVKSRKIFFALSQICNDRNERAVLELLSSKTERGTKLFETFVQDQRRSIFDILKEFPSCQSITLQNLINLLPPIPPRYYSVSSSPLGKNGNALTVAFSVVDYLTPSLASDGAGNEIGLRRVHGLATSHLEATCSPFISSSSFAKAASCDVKIFSKPSDDFHLPDDPTIPLILVGPGTGIAPFLGFLSHRKALDSAAAEVGVGSVEVFFGCRHADHDYLYREELEVFQKEGVISHLHTAFSRDGATKEYVQDLMTGSEETSKRLADTILNKNGRVYVCGDGNHMGRDVQAAIARLLGPHIGSENAGKEHVETMKKDGRFLLDIWS